MSPLQLTVVLVVEAHRRLRTHGGRAAASKEGRGQEHDFLCRVPSRKNSEVRIWKWTPLKLCLPGTWRGLFPLGADRHPP